MFTHVLAGRKELRKALSLCFVMAIALCCTLFLSCEQEADDEYFDGHKIGGLFGTWTDQIAGDTYIITEDTLSYDSGYDPVVVGTIRYVSNFSDTSGVIIIKYTEAGKPQYYNYDENWEVIGDPYDPPGMFQAVYYTDLGAASLKMSSAYKAGGPEAVSFDAAITTFCKESAVGNFVGQWGGPYDKQP
jgi:hypothetical protein